MKKNTKKHTEIYKIDDILDNHFNNIIQNTNIILNICIFYINYNVKLPFLQYLLFKNKDSTNDEVLTFPFKIMKKGENILIQSKKIFKEIIGDEKNPLGFLQNNEQVYVFFHVDMEINNTSLMYRKNEWWWTLIDEICNSRKLINFPIHQTVYSIFYLNPKLIYLIENNKEYEIPIVGYYGTSSNLLNYVTTLGIKASIEREFGPFYYFKNFIGATRRAGWSSNYKKIYIEDTNIVKTNGQYKQGGYVRFALFTGISKIIMYRKSSKFHNFISYFDNKQKENQKEIVKYKKNINNLKNKWVESYDSLIINNIKYKNIDGYYNLNKAIIIKDFNSFTPLSSHLLDSKTLKELWDPFYKKYNIL